MSPPLQSRLGLAWDEFWGTLRAAREDHWYWWPALREAWWGAQWAFHYRQRPAFNPEQPMYPKEGG